MNEQAFHSPELVTGGKPISCWLRRHTCTCLYVLTQQQQPLSLRLWQQRNCHLPVGR